MENDDLQEFRERWKCELKQASHEQDGVARSESLKTDNSGTEFKGTGSDNVKRSGAKKPVTNKPNYVWIAEELLEGRTSPLRDSRKRHVEGQAKASDCSPGGHTQGKSARRDALLEQLIQDLNEINEIPFFDVELPYELALKIFQYLSKLDLGRCAQVSKTWRILAEDEVLWYRLCLQEGFCGGAGVSDSPCWKGTLRDCKKAKDTLRYNWKNRVGAITQLQYELGKVLCDVSSSEGFVIAGYTSGDVRLWNTVHWDSGASYLLPSHARMEVPARPHVSHVKSNHTVAAAAYEDGSVDVWSVEAGQEPVYHYQHLHRIQGLAVGSEGAAVATTCGTQVRIDQPDDKGHWRTLCLTELQKHVESLLLVPSRGDNPVAVAAAGDSVYLMWPQRDASLLHCIYGHPVTCLDSSPSQVALGVKSCGWGMNDGGNKIHLYSLETGQSVACVGRSTGDFTCINLKDGPAHLLACGNKDRRVRVFDLRSGSSVMSLYGHHLGVTAVQADDWKIVSGGAEGLLCVWEMRMGAKLWEVHNRHPVRHVRFDDSTLVTANIPDDKFPRGACITDDDLTAHRRHRGVIYLYDFSADGTVPDHILPICRSDYSESTGYNYNIGLAVPYDTLSGARGPL